MLQFTPAQEPTPQVLCASCLVLQADLGRSILENKPKPDSSEIDLIPVEGAFEVVVGRREIISTGLVHLFCCRH